MQTWKAFVWLACRFLAVLSVASLVTGANAQDPSGAESLVDDAALSARELERQAFEILYGFNQSGDIDLAMRLLIEAAEAGSAAAADRLAFAYGTGDGMPEDSAEAFRLQRQAAEAGSASSQLRVGLQYMSGSGVEADPAEARKWFEAAAAQGDRRALYALAGTYLGASFEETDMNLLLPPLTRSAELGDPAALRELGMMLLLETERLDPVRGIHALELAAASFPDLASNLASFYLSGTVVERDLEKAIAWLSEAEAAGDLRAKLWLAELLQRGLGVARDVQRAETMRDEVLRAASASEKNAMAWDLSISADPFLRNGELAVRLMESLLDSPELLDPARLDTLAAAYAEVGRFDDAVATQLRAIELLQDSAEPASAGAEADPDPGGYRQRLDLYRAGQPYRAGQ